VYRQIGIPKLRRLFSFFLFGILGGTNRTISYFQSAVAIPLGDSSSQLFVLHNVETWTKNGRSSDSTRLQHADALVSLVTGKKSSDITNVLVYTDL